MSSPHEILSDLSGIRTLIRERLLAMTHMTEREVLAAGESLNQVVNRARGHVELTRGALENAAGTGDGASASEGAAQSEEMKRFLGEMSSDLSAQRQHAALAHSRSAEIGITARSIGALARAAHILSLNAKIETARSSQGAGVFSAISDEMKKLSIEVQKANAQAAALSSQLVETLPQVASLAEHMQSLTQAFSVQLSESIDRARAEEARLRNEILAVLGTGDEVLAEVLAQAGKSLSHLQFQDSTAQGLLEIDRWLHDLEARTAAHLEIDFDGIPPTHVTMGDSGDYDHRNAGVLTLL